jgi:hypothetical protein
MARMGLGAYSISFPFMVRSDVNNYYHKCLTSSAELSKKIMEVLLNKGIYSRSPYVSIPNEIGFIKKQDYKNG